MDQITQLTPEMLVPRLGEYLAQRGFITDLDLQKALAYQQEKMASNQTYLLGQALIDLTAEFIQVEKDGIKEYKALLKRTPDDPLLQHLYRNWFRKMYGPA